MHLLSIQVVTFISFNTWGGKAIEYGETGTFISASFQIRAYRSAKRIYQLAQEDR